MPFDPNIPGNQGPLSSSDIRGQLNALKALIDTQAAEIASLQQQINARALMPTVGEFDPGIHNPPVEADLEEFRDYIRDLAQQLLGETW